MESRKILIANSRWPRNWWGHRTILYNLKWDEESAYLMAILGYRDAGEALRGIVERMYKARHYGEWREGRRLAAEDRKTWLELSCLRWQLAWLEHRGEVGRKRFARMVERGIGLVVAEGIGEGRSEARKASRRGMFHRVFRIWQETLWQWWVVRGELGEKGQEMWQALKAGLWEEFEGRHPALAKAAKGAKRRARAAILRGIAGQAGPIPGYEKRLLPEGKGCEAREVEGGTEDGEDKGV